jgi:hypothetical protein
MIKQCSVVDGWMDGWMILQVNYPATDDPSGVVRTTTDCSGFPKMEL